MDQRIEAYMEQIVSQLSCSSKEKQDIMDEMSDHLYLLKNEFLEKGFSEEEAALKALEGFGEQENLIEVYQNLLFSYGKPLYIGTWILFTLYSFLALFKLLFERVLVNIAGFLRGDDFNLYTYTPPSSGGYFDLEVWSANANLIPFKNTIMYITGFEQFNTNIIIDNVFGNIVLFLPLGIFLPILFEKYRSFSELFAGVTVISFLIESLQIIFRIGQFDIDDIILNIIGALIGFFIFKMIKAVNLEKLLQILPFKLKWKR